MKSGKGEEGGTVNTAFVEPEALVVEFGPFDALKTDKSCSHHGCQKQPTGPGLPFLHRHLGKVIGKRTADKNDGVDARQKLRHGWKLDPVTEVRRPGTCSLP